MRGNPPVGKGDSLGSRSIPACAGEPLDTTLRYTSAQVYPRVCGGTIRVSSQVSNQCGLSPRVRGNRVEFHCLVYTPRSIPACAGEPHRSCASTRSAQVYPRVCGGTRYGRPLTPSISGLSPRVRGNLDRKTGALQAQRSIPACAGEPGDPAVISEYMPVYPRVCGGTAEAYSSNSGYSGLSPRVRGNLRYAEQHTGKRGSIPACAGEPGRYLGSARQRPVYPRVCGGTGGGGGVQGGSGGLSPRVRGNRGGRP